MDNKGKFWSTYRAYFIMSDEARSHCNMPEEWLNMDKHIYDDIFAAKDNITNRLSESDFWKCGKVVEYIHTNIPIFGDTIIRHKDLFKVMKTQEGTFETKSF